MMLGAFCWGDSLNDYKLAKKYYKENDRVQAVKLFERVAKSSSPLQDFALYYLALISDENEAVKYAKELVAKYPEFPLSTKIKKKMSEYYFDREQWRYFSEKTLWDKATGYYNGKNWLKAKKAYEQFLLLYPAAEKKSDAYYYLALIHLKLQDNLNAERYFALLGDNSEYAGWALFQRVAAMEAQGDRENAREAYIELANNYKGAQVGKSALDSLIKIYWKTDQIDKVIDGYKLQLTYYPNDSKTAWIYYQLGRIADNSNNIASANYYYEAASQHKSSKFLSSELYYRRAVAHAKLGNQEQSRTLLTKIAQDYDYNYYGHLAHNELNLKLPGFSTKGIIPVFNKWKNAIPRVKTFLSIGDYEDAAVLVRAYQQKSKLSEDYELSLFLISLYENDKNYSSAIQVGESVWGSFSRSNSLSILPKEIWKKSYPLYYKELILPLAERYAIDPLLVMALIREESRFDASCTSWAGAKGLMQLMPETAQAVAKSSNLKWGDLYSPSFNIQIGILHFSYLLNSYKNNYSQVLAAYNGGINAANRWISSNRGATESEFTEYITYEESRNYVKKVLNSYWIYKRLYSIDLKRDP